MLIRNLAVGVFLVMVLFGCGANGLTRSSPTAVAVISASLNKCEISSREQHDDASYMNDYFVKTTHDKLISLLDRKRISVSDDGGRAVIDCRIEVTYGNRSMRYWSGAGSGAFEITIELKDREGKVHHKAYRRGTLDSGIFGGDMVFFGRGLINDAIDDFGYWIVAASSAI